MLVRVSVRGTYANGQAFEEQAETVSVNAHGALLLLSGPVNAGAELKLWHRSTLEEAKVRVAYLGPRRNGRDEVGVQFTEPSPHFWRVAFPPDDWSPSLRSRGRSTVETIKPVRDR